jgi:hypothetical protein
MALPQVPKKLRLRPGSLKAPSSVAFATKEELFTAAVVSTHTPAWAHELEELAGTGQPRENLIYIVVGVTRFVHEMLPLWMVAWSSKQWQLMDDLVPMALRATTARQAMNLSTR